VLASTHPRVVAYDPAYAYEMALIVGEGIRRMAVAGEDLIYYITAYNEPYPQPAMPPEAETGVLKGMYLFRPGKDHDHRPRVHLLGSGPILNDVLQAANRLEADHGVAADVWSVTSFTELYREAADTERWNRLHPEEKPRVPYVESCLSRRPGVVICASDQIRTLPDTLARWVPGRYVTLGTDGLGRSDTREALRDFFEVDEKHIMLAALTALSREGKIDPGEVARARNEMGIDPEKRNPTSV